MRLRLGFAVLAALMLTGGVAVARGGNIPSEIVVFDGGVNEFDGYAFGFIGSKANERCAKYREIEMRAVADKGTTVLKVMDDATTSRRGYWHLSGPYPDGTQAVVLKMPKAEIKVNGHTRTCSGDSEIVGFVPVR
jgi:hypothetical protein